MRRSFSILTQWCITTAGKMERISKIILYREGKVLLQLRDNKPGINYPDTWSLIGGFIDDGETPEQAALREVEEEIGLKLNSLVLLSSRIAEPEKGEERFEENMFAAELPCDISELSANEGREIRMFSVDELDDINIRQVFKDAIGSGDNH